MAADRILDATKRCTERFGISKLSLDDVAAEAGVSRATLYRLYPGGKDTLCEALRQRELESFFSRLFTALAGADGLEDTLVRVVVAATTELRSDEHLSIMLATQPGETMRSLTVDGLPQIIAAGTHYLAPLADAYLDHEDSLRLVELLTRLVLSYFLAPSRYVDLADPVSASHFIHAHVLPAFRQEAMS